jgi:hypothetical protein
VLLRRAGVSPAKQALELVGRDTHVFQDARQGLGLDIFSGVHRNNDSGVVALPVVDGVASPLMIEDEPQGCSYPHYLSRPNCREFRA